MKSLICIMFFVSVFFVSHSVYAGLTEDELKPYEKVLPKGMTPKEISEWPLEITDKEDKLRLEVATYKPTLNAKDKKKLEKKKEVLLRVAGSVIVTEPGKKPKPLYKGNADIYVYSAGDEPKVVGKKSLKLSKLCPS